MNLNARQRFLNYVRDPKGAAPVCSPFLPAPGVIEETLHFLGKPVLDDAVRNEISLSKHLGYEPMFMADLCGMIFNWQIDETRYDQEFEISVIQTAKGEWLRKSRRGHDMWNDDSGCPVLTEEDHKMFVLVCEQVGEREDEIRRYYRDWRKNVGENGVIVLGHPHPSWLGYQINPSNIFYHWTDFRDTFVKSMDAVFEASLFVMAIAMDEGIDFMSDSSYGMEMTSPELFHTMDLPYIQKFAAWTHERHGLFWYHNCGFTRHLIMDGTFDKLGADVIETIAPPPEGDNELRESRRYIDPGICTKGNLNLGLLRDGSPDEVAMATRDIVRAVDGYSHIFSTADGVLENTPPENYITFVQTVQEMIC
jgi:hypothetical protein